MSDEMVERVARAICRHCVTQPEWKRDANGLDPSGWSIEQEVDFSFEEYLGEARAAIEAMSTHPARVSILSQFPDLIDVKEEG